MPRFVVGLLTRLCETLELFWPAGLALLQVSLVSRGLKRDGEAYEWTQYLLLGTAYPAAVLTMIWAGAVWRRAGWVLRPIKLVLAAFGLWVCGRFGYREFTLPVLLIACGHWILMTTLGAIRLRRRGGVTLLALRWWPREAGLGSRAFPDALAGLLVMVLAWSVAVRMLWWTSFAPWVASSAYTFCVFLVASILVAANLSGNAPRRPRQRSWVSLGGNLLALAILALASLRADSLGGAAQAHAFHERGMVAFHHWGAIVAPAELVRHGGWLLWDVPSQYGFLSALTIAVIPLKSVWQSFYVLNAVLTFLSASFLYAMCRSLRTGRANLIFSLAVALAAVAMVPGWPLPSQPTGPYVTPAVGAYRFFWCYALLAVLVWEYRTAPEARRHWRPLALGSTAWLLGSLWSCESAAYCAAIWLPAYLVMLRRRALAFDPDGDGWNSRRIRLVATWLPLPLVLLLAAWGVITIFYVTRLGQPPDWQAFVDHARSTRSFALPIEPRGIVLVQFLVFAALSTLAATCAGSSRSLGALAMIGGAWGACWATSSYFVGRSHEVNGVNLSPLLCAGMAVSLYLLTVEQEQEREDERGRTAGRLAPLIKKALAPVFAVLLTTTFGVETRLPTTLAAMRRGYLHRIDESLLRMDARLAALFDAAHVRTTDPVATDDISPVPARTIGDGRHHHRRVVLYKNWAPPMTLLSPLPPARRAVYVQRCAERAGAGGWLVQKKDQEAQTRWYRDLLLQTHRATQSFDDPQWALTRLEAKTLRR
jgi:hypothetical protein